MAHNFTNVIMLVVILKNLEDWGQISNKNQELLSHKSNMKVERKESIGLAKKFFQSFLYHLKGKTKEFNTKTKWSKIWETGTPNMKKKHMMPLNSRYEVSWTQLDGFDFKKP